MSKSGCFVKFNYLFIYLNFDFLLILVYIKINIVKAKSEGTVQIKWNN